MNRAWRALAGALLLTLAACAKPPEPVRPALWEVQGAGDQRAWLLGTVHALPEPVKWRSQAIDDRLARADLLLLEIADSGAEVSEVFTRLSRTPGLPPVADRVSPQERPRLAALLREFKLKDADFQDTETWAVAIILSQHAQGEAKASHGVEAELRRAAGDKPVGELEGAASQLAIFDRLAEEDQRALLSSVIAEASDTDRPDSLGDAWKIGDMAVLERETKTGMMADPELRAALLVDRNRVWSQRIARMLASGRKPFVAVGAAHMAGPDGLPALLADAGFKVTRVQ